MDHRPTTTIYLLLLLLLLFLMISRLEAQSTSSQNYDPYSSSSSRNDIVSNFEPSLAVVTGILGILFLLTFCLLVYAKCCYRRPFSNNNRDLENQNQNQARLSSSRFSGIDKTVIDSLPFFRFVSLKGFKQGLECAVCLSKFEDIEILRLLPKCKHAFHIDCIDQWLEKHSSCPLCRFRINPADSSVFDYSNSLRLMIDSIDNNDDDTNNNNNINNNDSSLEIRIEREENDTRGSSRFSIGGSFRKIFKNKNAKEISTPRTKTIEENRKILHKLNHKIVVSDVVFKNRWSNVSSSDLLFLNSEMIDSVSSQRFSQPSLDLLPSSSDSNQAARRSVSEITVVPRFVDFRGKSKGKESGINVEQERSRRLWLPIARRTVQWFANREKRSQINKTEELHV